jgi:serine protease Do
MAVFSPWQPSRAGPTRTARSTRTLWPGVPLIAIMTALGIAGGPASGDAPSPTAVEERFDAAAAPYRASDEDLGSFALPGRAAPPVRAGRPGLLVNRYFEHASRPAGGAAAAHLRGPILELLAEDPAELDALAWRILTDTALRHPDLDFALKAAQAAHLATAGQDVDVLETLARALFLTGRREEAIATHRRAIRLASDQPRTRLVLEEILADYLDPPEDPGPDDEEIIRRIQTAAAALIDQGRAVPVIDLLDAAAAAPSRVELAIPSERSLTGPELYATVRPSVVVMAALEPDEDTGELEITLASGFVIHASGIVATNFHVVDAPSAPVLVAMTADGGVHPVVEILAASPFADVAICRIDGPADLPPLPCVADAPPGTRLFALSHPDGAFFTLTEGILSRYFVHREDGQSTTMFTTTADFAVGSSGGPLVDERGNVVGMVSSTLAIYATEGDTGGRRGRAPAAVPGEVREPIEGVGRDARGATGGHAAGSSGGVAESRDRADSQDGADIQDSGPLQDSADFQMGLNMCVPAAEILRLTRE